MSDDWIVTAAHVCATPGITINGLEPTRLYSEPGEDLCLLEVLDHKLEPLSVRQYALSVGERVWVYGAPMGEPDMLTIGFASKLTYVELGTWAGIRRRLSAPSYGGNSGGPVLDDNGFVIGVLVAGSPTYPNLSFSARLSSLRRIYREGFPDPAID